MSRLRLPAADLELLLAVTRHLAAPFDLSTMLREVTDAAQRLLHAERCSVWLLDAAAGELVLEVASDLREVRVPLSHGLIGACARSREPINVPDCYADPRFDRGTDQRSGFHTRCALTLPLVDHREQLVGVMQVLNRRGGVFGDGDVELAQALSAQAAVALARAALTQQALQAERLQHELAVARQVQTSALPHALPELPGYAMHAVFRPAAETGGDGYDLRLDGGRLTVLLADAAGHGIGPALAVVQLQSMLRAAQRLKSPLEGAYTEVNNLLADTLPDGHFITAFVGEVDTATHALRWISGGQAPILVFRAATAGFEVHKATSFPMGAMPLARPPRVVDSRLDPGDLLVLLSDGIYEYENAAGEAFGRTRVEAAVAACAGEAPRTIVEHVLDALAGHAAGAAQDDDITAVIVQRTSAG
jgi:phosphoserine phosphatase